MAHDAPTPAHLAEAYAASAYPAQGYSLAVVLGNPDLRAGLEGLAASHRRRMARLAAGGVGMHLVKTQPEAA